MTLYFFAVLGLSFFVGCGPQTNINSNEDKESTVVTSEKDDGVIEGAFKSNSTETQTLASDSNNASISIPPDSLAIDVSIEIDSGDDLVDESAQSLYGLEEGESIDTAGKTIVYTPSEDVDLSTPATLSIAIDEGAGLNLNAESAYTVMFKVKKAAEGGQYYVGIYPPNKVSISGGSIQFSTLHFGAFQPVKIPVRLKENIENGTVPKEVKTSEPIVRKNTNLAQVGRWKTKCFVEYEGEQSADRNYMLSVLTISTGERLAYSAKFFSDEACSKMHFAVAIEADYSLGDANNEGIQNLDITVTASRRAYFDAQELAEVNSHSACTKEGKWVLGEYRTMTSECRSAYENRGDESCSDGDGDPQVGDKFLTITKIEPDKMTLGKEDHGDSESTASSDSRSAGLQDSSTQDCSASGGQDSDETRPTELSDRAEDIFYKVP